MKVTIVGAGNVGASCAEYIAIKRIASQVVLLDIKEGLAEGKALDLSQTSTTLGFNTEIIGVTKNYSLTSKSDVVVITSGIPRKPGMTREELIGINAGIVKDVSKNILKFSPDAVIVVVSTSREDGDIDRFREYSSLSVLIRMFLLTAVYPIYNTLTS